VPSHRTSRRGVYQLQRHHLATLVERRFYSPAMTKGTRREPDAVGSSLRHGEAARGRRCLDPQAKHVLEDLAGGRYDLIGAGVRAHRRVLVSGRATHPSGRLTRRWSARRLWSSRPGHGGGVGRDRPAASVSTEAWSAVTPGPTRGTPLPHGYTLLRDEPLCHFVRDWPFALDQCR